jgi:hypothetical protein
MEAEPEEGRMYITLGLLQAFIALGAIGGGLMLLIDPSGAAMGVPVSMLEGSVFPDFLMPGLFLFAVNGLGSLVGAVLSFTKNHHAPIAAIALGAILVAWIVIQVSIIQSIHWLHALYFVLGLVELVLGVLITRRQRKAA